MKLTIYAQGTTVASNNTTYYCHITYLVNAVMSQVLYVCVFKLFCTAFCKTSSWLAGKEKRLQETSRVRFSWDCSAVVNYLKLRYSQLFFNKFFDRIFFLHIKCHSLEPKFSVVGWSALNCCTLFPFYEG